TYSFNSPDKVLSGVTVYSPLKHWGAAPGKKVGILGIGGLGHLAIKIAKAMGAHVVVFTTSASKVKDAQRLGADEAVLSTDADQMAKYARSLHFIIDTVMGKRSLAGSNIGGIAETQEM